MKVAMLLLAAGRGTRFGGPVPKVYADLDGKPVLLHAAERLRRVAPAPDGTLVVVVGRGERETLLRPLLPALQRLGATIADGGATRQESMRNGLASATAVAGGTAPDFVLVHDAARPLLPVAAARECLRRATSVGAALLAVPAADTIKRVSKDDLVAATLDRDELRRAQTPQVIRRELLQMALEHAARTGAVATDDTALVEALGFPVAVVHGSPRNLKITGPDDLAIAAALLALGPDPADAAAGDASQP
ncbi:MAG: 2-C-methyl-D-erythritol 4-phosphate cytidylyltransferase [Planctomycetota bacterium]